MTRVLPSWACAMGASVPMASASAIPSAPKRFTNDLLLICMDKKRPTEDIDIANRPRNSRGRQIGRRRLPESGVPLSKTDSDAAHWQWRRNDCIAHFTRSSGESIYEFDLEVESL